MICTFFGHRNAPEEIMISLETLLRDLIENEDVDTFYVGNHGSFDSMVRKTLNNLKIEYPKIKYTVFLSYLPVKKREFEYEDYSDTVFPEILANTPPKYAIAKLNRWMIRQSDIVITYVTSSFGGAAQFKELAEKQGKKVINIELNKN